eukprot:3941404-Rhodomonas_salina.1
MRCLALKHSKLLPRNSCRSAYEPAMRGPVPAYAMLGMAVVLPALAQQVHLTHLDLMGNAVEDEGCRCRSSLLCYAMPDSHARVCRGGFGRTCGTDLGHSAYGFAMECA